MILSIGISNPRDQNFFVSVMSITVESPGKNFCLEVEISLSYMNKQVDGFIFSHSKTVYKIRVI